LLSSQYTLNIAYENQDERDVNSGMTPKALYIDLLADGTFPSTTTPDPDDGEIGVLGDTEITVSITVTTDVLG